LKKITENLIKLISTGIENHFSMEKIYDYRFLIRNIYLNDVLEEKRKNRPLGKN